MTRIVAACPFCRAVSAGVDTATPALVVAAGRPGGLPCPHLALVIAGLAAYDRVRDRVVRAGGSWVWVRGGAVEAVGPWEPHPLREWVERVAQRFAAPDELPTVEYAVGGGTDLDRELSEPGTGEFRFRANDGRTLLGFLNGWAVYSSTPDSLVAEARRLACEAIVASA